MAPENQKKTDPSTILGDHYANPQPTKIHITEDTEAKGDLAGAYDFSHTVHFSEGHLIRRHKEMIASYVSFLNRCPY
jgi:hypothetical protein